VLALLGAVTLGAVLELLQQFVPGREMSAIDGMVNAVGVIIGALVARSRRDDLNRLLRGQGVH
jgi:VanZ family protein